MLAHLKMIGGKTTKGKGLMHSLLSNHFWRRHCDVEILSPSGLLLRPTFQVSHKQPRHRVLSPSLKIGSSQSQPVDKIYMFFFWCLFWQPSSKSPFSSTLFVFSWEQRFSRRWWHQTKVFGLFAETVRDVFQMSCFLFTYSLSNTEIPNQIQTKKYAHHT